MSELVTSKQSLHVGAEVASILHEMGADKEKTQIVIEDPNHPVWERVKDVFSDFLIRAEEAKTAIIEWLSDLTIPAQEKFIIADNFTKSNKTVKFWGFGSNFESWFMPMTEVGVGEATVAIGKLRVQAKLADMTAEMPVPRLVTTSQIYWMLYQQPKGEKPNGKNRRLLTDGSSNLFRALDEDGIERAVFAYWIDDGWDVYANDLEFQLEWNAGFQVVSRKS